MKRGEEERLGWEKERTWRRREMKQKSRGREGGVKTRVRERRMNMERDMGMREIR